jgi:hypothetical protein
MTLQGGDGIRGPATAPAGGTVEIEIGSNDKVVWVNSGPGNLSEYRVPPSKKITVPVPATPGEVMAITVGKGLSKRSILITIVAPSP